MLYLLLGILAGYTAVRLWVVLTGKSDDWRTLAWKVCAYAWLLLGCTYILAWLFYKYKSLWVVLTGKSDDWRTLAWKVCAYAWLLLDRTHISGTMLCEVRYSSNIDDTVGKYAKYGEEMCLIC